MTKDAVLAPPRRRALWLLAGSIGSFVLLSCAISVYAWISAGQVLERERESVSRRLEEFRSRTIVRRPILEPAEDGNAWEHFAEALRLHPPHENFWPYLEQKRGARAIERIKALQLVTDRLRAALRQTHCVVPTDFGRLREAQSEHVWAFMSLIRNVNECVSIKLESEEDRTALEWLALGYAACELQACLGFATHSRLHNLEKRILKYRLKEALAANRATVQDWREFGRCLETIAAEERPLIEFLRREDLAIRCTLLDLADRGGAPADFELLGIAVQPGLRRHLPGRFHIVHLLALLSRMMQSLEDAARLPLHEQLPAVRGVPNALGLDSKADDLVPETWEMWIKDRQSMSLARLAVSLARCSLEKGGFPAKLSDLAPEYLARIPEDPWNGQAFGYVNRGDSAIVYAWGPDGDDDRGRPTSDDEALAGEDGDIVWTVKKRAPDGN